MYWVWASLTAALGLAGPALTLFSLPGTWYLVLLMLLGRLAQPPLFEWWTIGICAGIAVLGEIVETGASAVAVRAGDGSKRGMVGAVIGGIVGAIMGAPFGLIVGVIVGGMIGAGVGAALAEMTSGRDLRAAGKSGSAAAVGRLAGTVSKTTLALIIYMVLVVAAFWP